jgi:hypothetical protein
MTEILHFVIAFVYLGVLLVTPYFYVPPYQFWLMFVVGLSATYTFCVVVFARAHVQSVIATIVVFAFLFPLGIEAEAFGSWAAFFSDFSENTVRAVIFRMHLLLPLITALVTIAFLRQFGRGRVAKDLTLRATQKNVVKSGQYIGKKSWRPTRVSTAMLTSSIGAFIAIWFLTAPVVGMMSARPLVALLLVVVASFAYIFFFAVMVEMLYTCAAHIYHLESKSLGFLNDPHISGNSKDWAIYSILSCIGSYFMTIYAFAMAYRILSNADAQAFNIDIKDTFTALYFSFVTSATLGYGDILPQSNFARGLVIFQIIINLIYVIFFFSLVAGVAANVAGGRKIQNRSIRLLTLRPKAGSFKALRPFCLRRGFIAQLNGRRKRFRRRI